MSLDEIYPLIRNIPWIKPISYIVKQNNIIDILQTICLCLAVNKKYFPVLQAVLQSKTVKYHLTDLNEVRRFICKLVVDTSYLNINTLVSLLLPKESYSIAFTQGVASSIFWTKPTMQIFQRIKEHLVFDQYLFNSALRSENETLILAIWKEIKVRRFDNYDITWLCEVKNVQWIEILSQYMDPLKLNDFFFDVSAYFVEMNNFELFRVYFNKVVIHDYDFLHLIKQAISQGNIEIVTFCMKKLHFEIDNNIVCLAYCSGKPEMVKLLKDAAFSPIDMKSVSIQYFSNLYQTLPAITFNVELLRELLSVCTISDAFITSSILSLIFDEDEGFHNVSEEVFRIFAEIAPTLTLPYNVNLGQYHLGRMVWCLKHFKQIQIPDDLTISEQQFQTILESGILEPHQIPDSFHPTKTTTWRSSILEHLHIKRTVYLFFSSETELRDNAELILEYL